MAKNIYFEFKDYIWNGITKIDYKPTVDGPVTFNETTRQNLVEHGYGTNFHLRYFECEMGGFSTLEKHEHVHVVVIARGKGKVIVDDTIHNVKPMDLIIIPNNSPHQLINIGEEPFGFFCIVDAQRDKFSLLTQTEIQNISENTEIKKFIQVPDKYFN
ncbi:cupin domain-containing protein [Alkalibaculum sporogenes]|nr:cupin domain-containing protein [Alkalibaculum sporogenes]